MAVHAVSAMSGNGERAATGGWRRAPLVVLLLAIGLGGCAARGPAAPVQEFYAGPTLTMPQLLSRLREHNAMLSTLYARHYTQGDVFDSEANRLRFINAEGDLFYRKPDQIWVRGKKGPVDVLEVGSDGQRYWMTDFSTNTHWWGTYAHVQRAGSGRIPIRPDVLLEVIGVGDIDDDMERTPVPTLRFNNDLDVYMVVWNSRMPEHWYAQKEIWYDRRSLLPLKVVLYDPAGRVIVRANLTEHRAVEIADTPEARWPKVATRYDLLLPETLSRISIEFRQMMLRTRTGQPKEGLIRYPEEPGVPADRVIRMDEETRR